jgi:hypothetical protein
MKNKKKAGVNDDVIRLAAEDQLRFAKMLLEPAPLTPAMERARAAHARLTQESLASTSRRGSTSASASTPSTGISASTSSGRAGDS